jgi:hypothetical protein
MLAKKSDPDYSRITLNNDDKWLKTSLFSKLVGFRFWSERG